MSVLPKKKKRATDRSRYKLEKTTVTVIGAGLAGTEAAWALANRGYSVRLCDMKPE